MHSRVRVRGLRPTRITRAKHLILGAAPPPGPQAQVPPPQRGSAPARGRTTPDVPATRPARGSRPRSGLSPAYALPPPVGEAVKALQTLQASPKLRRNGEPLKGLDDEPGGGGGRCARSGRLPGCATERAAGGARAERRRGPSRGAAGEAPGLPDRGGELRARRDRA